MLNENNNLMKFKILICCIFFSQVVYSQALSSSREQLKTRLSAQNNWQSVIMMQDLNIEGENGMTWRNESESYYIELEFEANGATDLGVKVLLKDKTNQEAIVGYNLTNEQLYINNINAGKSNLSENSGIFTNPMKIERGRIKLQIFVNKTSVEVFANEGEASVFAKVFPEENSTDWQIFSVGKAKIAKLSVFEQRN